MYYITLHLLCQVLFEIFFEISEGLSQTQASETDLRRNPVHILESTQLTPLLPRMFPRSLTRDILSPY